MTDAGEVRGSTTAVCLPSVDALRADCVGRDTEPCVHLLGEQETLRDEAYLQLVLEATPVLRSWRFRHGPRVGMTLADAVSLVATDRSMATTLAAALRVAFDGCRDHRILGRPVTSAVCETAGGGVVEGLEEAPCLGLDHSCGRGYFDPARACCDVSNAIPGASCEASRGSSEALGSLGACNESGRCELDRAVDESNAYAWTEVVPARSGPPRIADWAEGDTVMVRVGESWDIRALSLDEMREIQDSMYGWARFDTDGGRRVPVSLTRVTLERNGGDGLLAAHRASGTVVLYLHEAQLGRGVETVDTVMVLTRPVDDYAYLGADGTTVPEGGTLAVPCGAMSRTDAGADEEPAPDSFSCRVSDEGFVRVAGPGLTGFLLPGGRPDVDVRPAGRLRRREVAALRRRTRPSVALEICSPIGSSRSCGCGTRRQYCVAGGVPGVGVWGACTGTELCNGCDDDADGNTDEGTASQCNDGLGCTADGCGSLFPNEPVQCINLPTPAVCRRGACTVGVCAGATSGTSPSQPTQRVIPTSPPGSGTTGCQWRESDNWCETQWDNCNCNGMARCNGTLVAAWSGTTPPATVPANLSTSLAACANRPPIGPRSQPGDVPGSVLVLCSTNSQCAANQVCSGGSCQNIRNGGCETNQNVCSVDRVCIEPNLITSTCRLFNPAVNLGGPALRAAQLQLQSLGVTSSTIDGLAVSCSTQTPPFPYNLLCQTDGRPCTVPHDPSSIVCTPSTGSCSAQTPVAAGQQTADIIGAQWNGTGFQPLFGNDCSAAIEGNPNSCYQETCEASTGLCAATMSNAVCNEPVAVSSLGNPSCGGPFVCTGLVSAPGALDPSTVGSFGQVIGGFQGCRRQSFCAAGTDCFAAGDVQPSCQRCDPVVSSNGLLPRTSGQCGGFTSIGTAERCGQCVTPGACVSRSPLPPGCDPI